MTSAEEESVISHNVQTLRKMQGLTQEQLAEKVGVSRQTVAKWESGESVPDLANSDALARALGVTLDDLTNYEPTDMGEAPPPRGRHIFGVVKVGERGQMVIPKKAREVFGIEPGDELLCLGDDEQGIALMKTDDFLTRMQRLADAMGAGTLRGGKGSER